MYILARILRSLKVEVFCAFIFFLPPPPRSFLVSLWKLNTSLYVVGNVHYYHVLLKYWHFEFYDPI